MIYFVRAVALTLLAILGTGYLVIGCLAVIIDLIGWWMNSTDRVLERLTAWGDSL